jgi:hypothetical protein
LKRQLGAAIRQVQREGLYQDQKVEKNHQSLAQRPRRAARI